MKLTPHVEAVQEDLVAVAAVAGAEHSELVARLAAALAGAFRLRLLEAVTEAAHELTTQLQAGHVEVRLEGGDPVLALVEEPEAGAPAYAAEEPSARITLRLPEALKAGVEAAAAREGQSVNAWLVQALARAVEGRPRGGSRLTGFARS